MINKKLTPIKKKASEIKEVLDPQVKKATQKSVNKIRNDIKKQNKANNILKKTESEKIPEKKKDKFADLKKLVEIKRQKALANELDSLIYEQEKQKKIREYKAKKLNLMGNYFAQNPEELKEISIDKLAKLSVILSSENAKEYIEWREALKMDGEDNRSDYLEKLVKHLEKRIDFLENLILQKL